MLTERTGRRWFVTGYAVADSSQRLSGLTADTIGLTRFAIDLGPFGGAESAGPGLWLWAFVYLGLVGAWALRGFARRDL